MREGWLSQQQNSTVRRCKTVCIAVNLQSLIEQIVSPRYLISWGALSDFECLLLRRLLSITDFPLLPESWHVVTCWELRRSNPSTRPWFYSNPESDPSIITQTPEENCVGSCVRKERCDTQYVCNVRQLAVLLADLVHLVTLESCKWDLDCPISIPIKLFTASHNTLPYLQPYRYTLSCLTDLAKNPQRERCL